MVGLVLEAIRNMVPGSMGRSFPLFRQPRASWRTIFPSLATRRTAPTTSPASTASW